jgi:hypothetical protein
MGSAWGRGVREGPAPQEVGKISSQSSARAEAAWRRKKRNGVNRMSYFSRMKNL